MYIQVNDLLDTTKKNLTIREMKGQDAFLQDVTWRTVTTFPEIEKLIDDGMSTRAGAWGYHLPLLPVRRWWWWWCVLLALLR